MMGWSPRCYTPSFMKISLLVLEKKIFEGFYHIWAWRPSWSCDQDHVLTNFHFLVPESFHTKFSSEWLSSFRENLVLIFVCTQPWAKVNLQYLHTFMKSISCQYLPTFRSQDSMLSEKSTVFTFSHRKA